MFKENRLENQFAECLTMWEISLLVEWDLLVFLHRHRNSLLRVEQMSQLLGYPEPAVNSALKTLETAGLIRRSRSSQGIRFNQLVSSVDVARQDCFEMLLNRLKDPLARGLVAASLARASGRRAVGGLRRVGLYLT